jgi:hypothetical protein
LLGSNANRHRRKEKHSSKEGVEADGTGEGKGEGATLLGEAKKAEGARKTKKKKRDGQSELCAATEGAMVGGKGSAERLLMTNSPGLVGPRRDDDDDDDE